MQAWEDMDTDDEERSYRKVAERFGLTKDILRWRLKGAKSRQEAHEDEQLLTKHEEKVICEWIKHIDERGFPIRVEMQCFIL